LIFSFNQENQEKEGGKGEEGKGGEGKGEEEVFRSLQGGMLGPAAGRGSNFYFCSRHILRVSTKKRIFQILGENRPPEF